MKSPSTPSSERRGVLLLVVLSMLTLFLLLGTAYMIASTRARVTARAFNRLVMQSDDVRLPKATYLDATLLHVLRGGTAAVAFAAPVTGVSPYISPPTFESLLEDKYGRSTTLTGSATQASYSSGTGQGAVFKLAGVTLSATTTGTAPAPPFPTAPELPGRIITLCPEGCEPTSHRILQAQSGTPGTGGSSFTLLVDTPSRRSPFRLPQGPCRVVLNGREFDTQGSTNEAWDGFDDKNPFLAHLEPSGTAIASSVVMRASFVPASQAAAFASDQAAADNDNDGQKDGAFLTFGFPGIPTSSGMIDLHASVLIVDLDSRFNANTHGTPAARMYPPGSAWPTVTGTNLANVPLGSGYGPPEVHALWMLPPTGTVNTLGLMTGGTGFSAARLTGSRFSASGSTPALQTLQGRYGERSGSLPASLAGATASTATTAGDPLPGKAGDDDVLSRITDQRTSPSYDRQKMTWNVTPTGTTGIPSLWWTGTTNDNWTGRRSSYNSPPDLHGRMKSVALPPAASGVSPRLAFAKAEWGDGETRDDPYELVLGPSAAQNGWMGDPNTGGFMPVYDNVYSIGELETVLRPYDTDSFRLPLRLSATLGPLVESSRLRFTTASWDTTTITGTAAANLATWIRTSGTTATWTSGTSPTSGNLGGEAARGERFDLNRPLTSTKPDAYDPAHPYYVQRQAYFKDLYTLICAILHPTAKPSAAKAKEYAQWAANVVEFRDADSTITPFEYDDDLFDGWGVDNDANTPDGAGVVWGAERPELLIMETSAWEDSSTSELFVVLHRPWNANAISTTGTVAAEPIDAALDVAGAVPSDRLDLGRKAGTSPVTDAAAYPIWRLRIEDMSGSRSYVRLDVTSPAGTTDHSASSVNAGASTPKMAADSWLCVYGGNSLGTTIAATGTVVMDRGGPFRVPGDPPAAPSLVPRRATVFLERLTDPSAADVDANTWTAAPNTPLTPHYHVVDQAPIEVVNRVPPSPGIPPPDPSKIKRDISGVDTALWKCLPATAAGQSSAPIELGPASFPSSAAKWFPWPNRPFVSAAELFLVPSDNAIEMLRKYQAPSPTTNFLRTIHGGANQLLLLDAVHVPTRFAGIHRTVTSDPNDDLGRSGVFAVTAPVNQLSSYREPGRVNLNTVTADDVWNAVIAGPLATSGSAAPLVRRAISDTAGGGTSVQSGTTPSANFITTPATSMGSILALSGTAPMDYAEDTHPALVASGKLNPANLLFTASRLANAATPRSNVFAIWVTLRESIQNDPDSVKYHRAFYIVDRSIPVAHEHGKDHNIWDAVLLRRIIE